MCPECQKDVTGMPCLCRHECARFTPLSALKFNAQNAFADAPDVGLTRQFKLAYLIPPFQVSSNQ